MGNSNIINYQLWAIYSALDPTQNCLDKNTHTHTQVGLGTIILNLIIVVSWVVAVI